MKPITLLFGLLILCACASGGTSATTASPGAEGLPTTADASGLTGTWRGLYVCAQGVTALELELRGMQDGRVGGTFAFSEAKENPGVPSGSYRVHGVLSAGLVLRLDPGEWIEHPQDYFPVALVGKVSGEESRYYGFVDGLGCETFSVTFR